MNIMNITITPTLLTYPGDYAVTIRYNAQLGASDPTTAVSVTLSIVTNTDIYIIDDTGAEVQSYTWHETYTTVSSPYPKTITFRVKTKPGAQNFCQLNLRITDSYGIYIDYPLNITYQ